MNAFGALISCLRTELEKPLPGPEAQYKMAPAGRIKPADYKRYLPNAKSGSVLILLFQHRNKVCLCLTVRQEYDGPHSGQVSFPGGRPEPGDSNLWQTACREAYEEVGVKDVKLVGGLTEIYIPASNFLVKPFVGYTEETPVFLPDPREVKQLLLVPLKDFMQDTALQAMKVKLRNGITINAPCYNVQQHSVWGATAMMIAELLVVARCCDLENL